MVRNTSIIGVGEKDIGRLYVAVRGGGASSMDVGYTTGCRKCNGEAGLPVQWGVPRSTVSCGICSKGFKLNLNFFYMIRIKELTFEF